MIRETLRMNRTTAPEAEARFILIKYKASCGNAKKNTNATLCGEFTTPLRFNVSGVNVILNGRVEYVCLTGMQNDDTFTWLR